MTPTIDYKLFNQVRNRFSAEPGTIVLISLNQDRIEELVPLVFTHATYHDYSRLMHEHWEQLKPHVVICRLQENDYTFLYVSKAFVREEDFPSGKIISFDTRRFRKLEFNIEKLRGDFAKLNEKLDGDSEAS